MPPDSRSPLPVRERSTRSITLTAMGTIIAAHAVFEIHMLRNAVATMKPATIAPGRVPVRRSVKKAMRRSSPQRSMASPRMKPPMKR